MQLRLVLVLIIISFSDSHSFWPWRLGREVTIFSLFESNLLSYDEIIRQIRENDFVGTIETDPAYGKYHFDGHANCSFSCSPAEGRELNGKCPVCNRDLVIGVDSRVDDLSSEDADYKNKKIFFRLLPLHEIISLGLECGMNTKKCWGVYDSLIKKFGSEFRILLEISRVELSEFIKDKLIVDLIIKNREGRIKVKPGYDGEYGVALLEGEHEGQEKLF